MDFVYAENCSSSEAENQTYSPFSVFPESPLLSREVNGSSVFNLKMKFIAFNFRNFGDSVSKLHCSGKVDLFPLLQDVGKTSQKYFKHFS